MPNNYVFSKPQDLKAEIYGSNGGTLTALSVDGTGQVNVTVTNTPGVSVLNVPEVSVSNTPSVNVDNTADVSVVNTPGVSVLNVPEVSVSNTPSVNVDNTADVSVVNTPGVSVLNVPEVSVSNIPSVEMHGVAFTSDSITVTTGTGQAFILDEDTSQQNEYSYYISNVSDTATMTLALQIAPVDSGTYFVDDASEIELPPQSITVLVPQKYLNYTRLSYDTGAETASFIAYYNAKI
jgi:hypothetical protein